MKYATHTICHAVIKCSSYAKTQGGQGVYEATLENVLAVLSYFVGDFICVTTVR